MLKKRNPTRRQNGFTFPELLIAMGIVGILMSVAVPQLSSYTKRGYNITAKSDLKNIYNAAQSYFSENPEGTPSLSNLMSYGYRQSLNVVITGRFGPPASLSITSSHNLGNASYTIDSYGTISIAPTSSGPGCTPHSR